jgi:hypothetical protein
MPEDNTQHLNNPVDTKPPDRATSGRDPLTVFDELPEKEAVELYRLAHNCSELQARFVVAMERGTLPTKYIDKDGREITIVY